MINPSVMDLLKKVDDRYSLVIVTSKRARQIIDGSEPLVETKSKKPLTIAINEVDEGEVGYEPTTVKEGSK
jgi:DNA-directed RNA polymerase subunit omega